MNDDAANDWPELLLKAFEELLMCEGVDNPVDLSQELVHTIMITLGGEQLYVPKKTSFMRRSSYTYIRAEFNGRNARQIARKYGFSVRQVQRILLSKE